LVLYNVISIRLFLPSILISELLCPPLPMTNGRVRRRACRQQWRMSINVRLRGKLSPKALVFPEPERVCLEVLPAPSKSYAPVGEEEKRWPVGKNPLRLSQGSLSSRPSSGSSHQKSGIIVTGYVGVFVRQQRKNQDGTRPHAEMDVGARDL
jgi:hypothetical protein